MLPQASNRANLQMFKPEKPNLSYADLHHEITKGIKDVSPKSSWKHRKQCGDTKASEEDELVKYMSNLPSYLERGEKPKEKVLNVGVLEWRRLEKWQYTHKHIPYRSSISSISSSNTSSSFSTDGSSTHSSGGHSCSPSDQTTHRISLQFHLMSAPVEDHAEVVKPSEERIGRFQELKAAQSNSLNEQGKFIRRNGSSCTNHQTKLEGCKVQDTHSKVDSKCESSLNDVKHKVASSGKVKMKTQDGEFMRKSEKFREGNLNDRGQNASEKRKAVLLLPKDCPITNHSGSSNFSNLRTKSSQSKAEPLRSFPEKSKVAHHAELNSGFPLSRRLSCEVDGSRHLLVRPMGSIDAKKKNDSSSERSHSVPRAAKIGISPSRSRNMEEKKLNAACTKSAANEPFRGSDLKVSNVASEKVRSTSPFRRFSFSKGKMGKSLSSKDAFAMPQLSSACTTKSDSENAVTSSCFDPSSGEKTNSTGRARSSPLRRLLDPLLKPKAVNCRDFPEPLRRNSISMERACKSSDGRAHSSTVAMQSDKVKSDMNSCCIVNVSDSSQDKKRGLSVVQALLRVQVKNGMPFFTFAVDNESDILAATLKILSGSRKDDNGCIFTFFSIREVKKKNGRWINQGGKGKGQDYIPNVVAQMVVSSSSEFSKWSRQNCVDQFSTREYVLLTVDVKQANPQTSDFQATDELVAIIVNIPKQTTRCSTRDGRSSENGSFMVSQDIKATVILPSGVHSLPSKGEPSSLIQRWRSGGSCDCGGWDIGCRLRVLSNGNQLNKRSGSLKGSPVMEQFELYFQGGSEQENKHFFSMAPFRDGIYSVEFNSSLSLMQAFSICIAAWDSSESANLIQERTSVDTVLMQNDEIRAPKRAEEEAPARYVSYPPVSPVGRV